MGKPGNGGLDWFWRWASGLRFPRLLALIVVLFTLDLFIPDLIPLADEILLGLLALLLGGLRRRRAAAGPDEPGVVEVEPTRDSEAPAPDQRR
jgi:hypothetical protein